MRQGRINGDGTFYQTKNGNWQCRIRCKDRFGKSCRVSGTAKTKKEAKRIAEEKRDRLKAPNYSEYTVAEYSVVYMKTWCNEKHMSPTYFEREVKPRFDNRINPYIGDYKLSDLKSSDIQKWVDTLSEEPCLRGGKKRLSRKTVSNILHVLSACLDKAVGDHIISWNPALGIKVPDLMTEQERVQAKKKADSKHLTDEQMKQFVSLARKDNYADEILFTLFTGCREGEVIGLQWHNVEPNVIHIVTQLPKGQKFVTGTKDKDPRDVYYRNNHFLVSILESASEKRKRYQKLCGKSWKPEQDLVFVNPDGSHRSPNTLYKHVKRIGREIGCPWLTVHDLRRTFATLLVEHGLRKDAVQGILGHTDIRTTEMHYLKTDDYVIPKVAKEMETVVENILEKGFEKEDLA